MVSAAGLLGRGRSTFLIIHWLRHQMSITKALRVPPRGDDAWNFAEVRNMERTQINEQDSTLARGALGRKGDRWLDRTRHLCTLTGCSLIRHRVINILDNHHLGYATSQMHLPADRCASTHVEFDGRARPEPVYSPDKVV